MNLSGLKINFQSVKFNRVKTIAQSKKDAYNPIIPPPDKKEIERERNINDIIGGYTLEAIAKTALKPNNHYPKAAIITKLSLILKVETAEAAIVINELIAGEVIVGDLYQDIFYLGDSTPF